MMEISVIASGSNGNSCLVEDKGVSVLIDAGKSGREIELRMERLGKHLDDVSGIILTHSHSDHISGAGILSRRYDIPIYLTRNTYSEASSKLGDITHNFFSVDKTFKIKDMEISPVLTSHKVPSSGFVIGKFGLFTDTGIVTKQMKDVFSSLNSVLIESNHDIDMLKNGHYPAFLKKWILSSEGHLSNLDASGLVDRFGKNLSLVLLGHLSGNNNMPSIAAETFESVVKSKIEYKVCSRDEETGTWKV